MMEQSRFISLLKKVKLKNLTLMICTNGTILPNDELKSLIEQCREVFLCVSLDGIYSTNDWYRWPSSFSEVLTNIKIYEEWWGSKPNNFLTIHHVVNAINVLELPEFVHFMKTELPNWIIEWDWIRWPYWQQLSALSPEIKNNLINEFLVLNDTYDDNETIRPNPYKVTIERMTETPYNNFDVLKKEVSRLSEERNLDFLNMVSKFRPYW